MPARPPPSACSWCSSCLGGSHSPAHQPKGGGERHHDAVGRAATADSRRGGLGATFGAARRAYRGCVPVPFPVLLHAGRVAAGEGRHRLGRRPSGAGQPHAHELQRDQREHRPARLAGQLGNLHHRVPSQHAVLRAAGRLRAGGPGLPGPGRRLRVGPARADHPVPAADDPAVRAAGAQLRPGRHLSGNDPSLRDQPDRGVHLSTVLPGAAPRPVRGGAHRRCRRVRHPLANRRPAGPAGDPHRSLITFIGPWNEFLWPFLITKDADMQPLAVSLSNYMSNLASRAANPFGATLAGRVCWRHPWSASSSSSSATSSRATSVPGSRFDPSRTG